MVCLYAMRNCNVTVPVKSIMSMVTCRRHVSRNMNICRSEDVVVQRGSKSLCALNSWNILADESVLPWSLRAQRIQVVAILPIKLPVTIDTMLNCDGHGNVEGTCNCLQTYCLAIVIVFLAKAARIFILLFYFALSNALMRTNSHRLNALIGSN